jgi:ABC-2 type transport system permease protein
MVVAATGVSLVWQGTWTKRLVMLLVVPSIIVGIGVGIFEQTLANRSARTAVGMVESAPWARKVIKDAKVDIDAIRKNPEEARHFAWTLMLFGLFRYPQSFGMIILLGVVAPRLISQDLRTRAYLLYLSRPLTPFEYVLGKAGVLYVLMTCVATIPALAIYFIGLVLSTSSWAIAETWDIPLRVLLATIFLVLPTSAIALAMSSMTKESRYASFAWFSLWLVGQVVYASLMSSHGFSMRQGPGNEDVLTKLSYTYMYLSPYELLGYLQKKAFGLLPDTPTLGPFLFAGIITVVGYSIAYWRVARTLKA